MSTLKPVSSADVIVIGGGLIGCSIALRLAQAGRSVCVLDSGNPGEEASAAAAGMLAPQGETVHPDEFFRFCAASRDLYSEFVREVEVISGEKIDYHRDGTLLVGISENEYAELDKILRAQCEAGLRIERWSPAQARAHVKGLAPEIQSVLFIPGDHWLDNEQLTRAVIKAGRKLGVTFCAGRRVTKLHLNAGRVESLSATFHTGDVAESKFSAECFVLAAGCWSAAIVEPLGVSLPVKPCRGQMIEFKFADNLPLVVRAGHHYLVPRQGGRMIVGTTSEDVGFEKGVTGEGLRSILEGAHRIAPFVAAAKFRRAWSGLRPDTRDHLPILGIGEIPNLVYATGHFRNGILLTPITASVVRDLVLDGATSHPIEAYSPTRFK